MSEQPTTLSSRFLLFTIENKLVVFLVLGGLMLWGVLSAPFDWDLGGIDRDPVPVDAIPDIGENQQIVFTPWAGRSPQDVEDQLTYPLTTALQGVPGVKTVRSFSYFGFSSIYVIFDEDVEFYWSRSRLLEKLNSLPPGTLPDGVQPVLGPDATALGQVFWYTLEGRDPDGNPTGGWGLDELRSIQDWTVRYALLSAEGVAEVASAGGFIREYQVDVDPDAMRVHGVTLQQITDAVRMSNLDIGAGSMEINRVEYFIRGIGFIKSVADIEQTVLKASERVPIYIRDVARVSLGPAMRRGALDKAGTEAVGGVVVVRYGANPLTAIDSVKDKIEEIRPGLPEKVVVDFKAVGTPEVSRFATAAGFDGFIHGELNQEAWLKWIKQQPPEQVPDWLIHSRIEIVPFYDRTQLIQETLGTLNTAIVQEILVTLIVVLVMIRSLSSSLLIAGLLPMAVLMTFIAMKRFGVDANVVALSGIAIAIGTMVDMGIVICENILRHLDDDKGRDPKQSVINGTREVGGAVMAAVATTIVGFLPVFAMEAAEGKLFRPLAFTKTFALIASVFVALILIPPLAHLLFTKRKTRDGSQSLLSGLMQRAHVGIKLLLVLTFAAILSGSWLPLGPERGLFLNALFVGSLIGGLLLFFLLFRMTYPTLLGIALRHKAGFLSMPAGLILTGLLIWLGAGTLLRHFPNWIQTSAPATALTNVFPGLGKEFMPPLDEGSYLFMPTTMPHASIGEALDVLSKQDMAIDTIPEVSSVVGKLGRADSPLDPAPVSMFETIINYRSLYLTDQHGKRFRFAFDAGEKDLFRNEDGHPVFAPDGKPYLVRGTFARDDTGRLIPDSGGAPFRLWRPALDPDLNEGREAWRGIQEPDHIWQEILRATQLTGTTSAPRLQPIAARIVMLQSGMRAPMGVKVKGPNLAAIETVGLQIEALLKEVPGVEPAAVLADRIVGKPYLEIHIDREAIARYGLMIRGVQDVIEAAIGGKRLTQTIEGRERYPVRVRYLRELRDQIEDLGQILIPAADGTQIPLTELAEIRYSRGPQVIKSEDTFLTGYVVFDKQPGYAEVDVVDACQAALSDAIASGELDIPDGVSYRFAGSYENQIRASKKLALVVPVALFVIFLILYLQFHSVATSIMVFSGILVAWAGGFVMIGLYHWSGFLDFNVLGENMRELFQIHTINLSVAIWVGFLALFGIASDDGVLMATVLDQQFKDNELDNIDTIRQHTIYGASLRIRPALMTSATTLLALIPVLTSTGRGSDIMVPMAIPSFGGMIIALITVFVVPVLYCWRKERQYKGRSSEK